MGGIFGKKNKRDKSGFSLVEILITITIIGIGLIGMLSFFSSSLRSHNEAKNELIAAGLAQEGAELIRNLAEYKKLHDNASWSDLVNASTGLPACKRIDHSSLTSHVCYDSSKSARVCLDADKRYRQCAASETPLDFSRTVTITDGGANGLIIVSQVTWNGRTTTATDRLYQNNY